MLLEQALAYIELGWAVFPVLANGKKPLTKNGFKDATKSAYTARKMWEAHPEANIGIATGQVSGLVVVDVDVKNGAKGRESIQSIHGMTPTLTVRTPSGGWHLYYCAPQEQEVRCRTGLLPGIDIKADGGYVVGPGSAIDGQAYEWTDAEAHMAALPEAVIKLMANGHRPAAESKAALEMPEQISEGGRNETLTRLAGAMRAKGMAAEEIAAALKAANSRRCAPPLPDDEVEAIAASIARYPPKLNTKHEPAASAEDDEAMPPGFTDDALALDFTARHQEDWRYVAAWGHWLQWDGARWMRETTLKAYDLSRRVCRQASSRCLKPKIAAKVASASTVAAVERLARADRRHAANVEQWDTDAWLLNTLTGAVDLRSGAARPHRREDYMTKLAAVKPGQEVSELWLTFLRDVTNGDEEFQRYLARVAGYALTGATTEHALFFCYGTGANGKSVFVNTLAAVMGDYAMNAPMDTFLETHGERHPTDLAGLRGARLVTSIEVEKGKRWAEAKIKALTGGDRISARFMRQDFFEYKPQFKLLIAGNNKPTIREVDEAMKRRIHLVPFTVTIPEGRRDKALPEKLLRERDGILRWAVEGCLEWQRIGLAPPPMVLSATEEYLDSEDSLGRWLDEECMKSDRATVTTEELYQSWKAWAEKQGEYVGTMKKLADDLSKRGFPRWRSSRKKGFRGLTLRGAETQGEML